MENRRTSSLMIQQIEQKRRRLEKFAQELFRVNSSNSLRNFTCNSNVHTCVMTVEGKGPHRNLCCGLAVTTILLTHVENGFRIVQRPLNQFDLDETEDNRLSGNTAYCSAVILCEDCGIELYDTHLLGLVLMQRYPVIFQILQRNAKQLTETGPVPLIHIMQHYDNAFSVIREHMHQLLYDAHRDDCIYRTHLFYPDVIDPLTANRIINTAINDRCENCLFRYTENDVYTQLLHIEYESALARLSNTNNKNNNNNSTNLTIANVIPTTATTITNSTTNTITPITVEEEETPFDIANSSDETAEEASHQQQLQQQQQQQQRQRRQQQRRQRQQQRQRQHQQRQQFAETSATFNDDNTTTTNNNTHYRLNTSSLQDETATAIDQNATTSTVVPMRTTTTTTTNTSRKRKSSSNPTTSTTTNKSLSRASSTSSLSSALSLSSASGASSSEEEENSATFSINTRCRCCLIKRAQINVPCGHVFQCQSCKTQLRQSLLENNSISMHPIQDPPCAVCRTPVLMTMNIFD